MRKFCLAKFRHDHISLGGNLTMQKTASRILCWVGIQLNRNNEIKIYCSGKIVLRGDLAKKKVCYNLFCHKKSLLQILRAEKFSHCKFSAEQNFAKAKLFQGEYPHSDIFSWKLRGYCSTPQSSPLIHAVYTWQNFSKEIFLSSDISARLRISWDNFSVRNIQKQIFRRWYFLKWNGTPWLNIGDVG